VILLRNVAHADDAVRVARKIIEVVSQPIRSHGHEMHVTCSVGISIHPLHGESAEALITSADVAMYHVKKARRNDFEFFTAEMKMFFPKRLALENELRKALERKQFVLHYQPQIDVMSGELTGVEALLRWHHPERGTVMPAEFISLAEETGLIVPLGQWVLREACLQSKAWQDQGLRSLRVAVNISGVQFQQKDLVDSIAGALRESGLDPRCLELEITESVIMHNASEAIVMLEKLSQMGVDISIDDFGTGYSSLSYLKRFSIDRLKIDQSFIRNVSSDQDDAAIVKAIIALAHSLRLRVVAEGVEHAEQLEFLRSLGNDEYQGYFHSKPLPAAEFERYLGTAGRHAGEPGPLQRIWVAS
jgi:EAL domain-containing protein (putative c-di-GMP-specific phosphodiesterase class I)